MQDKDLNGKNKLTSLIEGKCVLKNMFTYSSSN